MKTVCELNKCNGCMACADNCPKKCIIIRDDIKSFNAFIDETACINCNMCKRICPNVTKVEKKKPIEWKQGWASNEIRNSSASGGAAAVIIKRFIEDGGWVASCLFKDGDFVFDITNDVTECKNFVGSKYVKSNPSGIYNKIKDRLKNDKVLFIGLPCQVAALKNYIKGLDNLYTIDLICHGTPSIKVLNKYLNEHGYDMYNIKNLKFRQNTDMGLFIDGTKVEKPRVMDDYLCTFLNSINYTENCYTCQFASLERVSDITLGDSWGSEYESESKKGISLIFCQTKKGKELLEKLDFEMKNVDLDNAIKNNHQLSHPSLRTSKRDKFLDLLIKGKSYKYSTLVCLPKTKLKQFIKKILIKIHLVKNDF